MATIQELEKKISELKRQLHIANEQAHRRNLELDAMHYVWCDGGCKFGVHRFEDHPLVTEELVKLAERNTKRLRSWFDNSEWRKFYENEKETRQVSTKSSFSKSLFEEIRDKWYEYKRTRG